MTDWTIRDTQIASKSIREGWPVPAEKRPGLIQNFYMVMKDQSRGKQERRSALMGLAHVSELEVTPEVAEMILEGSATEPPQVPASDSQVQANAIVRLLAAVYVEQGLGAAQAMTRNATR